MLHMLNPGDLDAYTMSVCVLCVCVSVCCVVSVMPNRTKRTDSVCIRMRKDFIFGSDNLSDRYTSYQLQVSASMYLYLYMIVNAYS